MALMVSSAVREKLEVVHGVTVAKVEECFRNCAGPPDWRVPNDHRRGRLKRGWRSPRFPCILPPVF